jgi:hypothetical protein
LEHQEEFTPRPPFSIDWHRLYDFGPSDNHLHAIGQFIVNYSMVEWEVSGLFAHFLKIPVADAQRLAVDANLSMAGKIRYVQGQIEESEGIDRESAEDILACLKEFEMVSKLRHKVVHWQWGLNEGSTATLTDMIKPRNPERSTVSLTLDELRGECLHLARIYRALTMNYLVITGQHTRQLLLSVTRNTSPEKLFRP